MENPNTFAVCLGRQLGSGGHQIAKELAERLHLKFYDRELLYVAASKSGYSRELFEKSDEEKSSMHTFFTSFIPFMGSTDFYGNQVDEESLFRILSQTVRELAEADNCIFVGRCAEYILRAKERMASVFISADAADRMERGSRDRGISRDEARKVILNNDKRRASFHNFYSEKRWGEAPTYDLCINSSRLGLEATRELIEGYIRQRFLL